MNDAGLGLEIVGASVAQKTTVAGALAGAVGWLAQINWVGLTGVLVAVLGMVANIYFQIRRDKRETAESLARIEALRSHCHECKRGDT
jgi:4-hydroxybenzoate polyprenyltransferase